MVKLIVNRSKYTTKKFEVLDCLECKLQFEQSSIEWKDFKQKLLFDIDCEVTSDNLIYVEGHGYNVNGFVIPWQVQYALIQAKEKGLI